MVNKASLMRNAFFDWTSKISYNSVTFISGNFTNEPFDVMLEFMQVFKIRSPQLVFNTTYKELSRGLRFEVPCRPGICRSSSNRAVIKMSSKPFENTHHPSIPSSRVSPKRLKDLHVPFRVHCISLCGLN